MLAIRSGTARRRMTLSNLEGALGRAGGRPPHQQQGSRGINGTDTVWWTTFLRQAKRVNANQEKSSCKIRVQVRTERIERCRTDRPTNGPVPNGPTRRMDRCRMGPMPHGPIPNRPLPNEPALLFSYCCCWWWCWCWWWCCPGCCGCCWCPFH